MNLFAEQEQRQRCREWMCGNRVGGMNWETGTDLCALPYVKLTASGEAAI